MRVKLSFRKQVVKLGPFTGHTFCGCRFIEGQLFEMCDYHWYWAPGRHSRSEELSNTS